MTQSDAILNLAKKNNGIVTTKMVVEQNLNRSMLTYLCDKGGLEKTARGVYILPNVFEDEFINLQSRFQKGVFSLETALFLHDLTDRTPVNFNMTFPEDYNLTQVKLQGVRCGRSKLEFYDTGIIEILTPSNNKVRVYSVEKTLCDILITRNRVDIGIISTAFKRYKDLDKKNIPLLSKYAKMLRVEKKVRTYLEVLL
ncbi:MAG: type IV toxin-antitoxin system AbiEi family antitoxin domain-containing protein [Clostridia bacterium]